MISRLTGQQAGQLTGKVDDFLRRLGMDDTGKILKLIAAAGEIKPGVVLIEIKHDEDCPALKTNRLADCTCNPDFKKIIPEEKPYR